MLGKIKAKDVAMDEVAKIQMISDLVSSGDEAKFSIIVVSNWFPIQIHHENPAVLLHVQWLCTFRTLLLPSCEEAVSTRTLTLQ